MVCKCRTTSMRSIYSRHREKKAFLYANDPFHWEKNIRLHCTSDWNDPTLDKYTELWSFPNQHRGHNILVHLSKGISPSRSSWQPSISKNLTHRNRWTSDSSTDKHVTWVLLRCPKTSDSRRCSEVTCQMMELAWWNKEQTNKQRLAKTHIGHFHR